jgi:hypothetical protein
VEEFSLWLPLIFAGVAYAVANVSAGVVASRDNEQGAERLRNIGFLIALLATAWVVVLLLIVLVDLPDKIGDMLTIIFVIVAFFAILLLVFFGLSELLGLARRALSRRRRVTTTREP